MKRFSVLMALVLAIVLIVSCFTGSVSAADDGIAESIALSTVIYDQRPDGYMFESSSPGLIQGMVNPTLGEDGTPVLNSNGWYKAESDKDVDVSLAVPDTSTDYSTSADFGFTPADFERWYHAMPTDPVGDIIAAAKTIVSSDADETVKATAAAYAVKAVKMATEIPDDVNANTEVNGKKVYTATEVCNTINDMRTAIMNAANGAELPVLEAEDNVVSGDPATVLESLDTSACKDVSLNKALTQTLVLNKDGELRTFEDGTQGYIYSYSSNTNPLGNSTADETGYFPIDGMGYGDFNYGHNYHFTMTFESLFVYHGGETFTFSGDDDVWVFINDQLLLDIGGVHSELGGTIDLDKVAAEQGFKPGDVCKMNFFFAERMTVGSNLKISSSIQFVPAGQEPVTVPPTTEAPQTTVITVVDNNPKTGITGFIPVAAVAIIAVGGMMISSKKKSK